ncbi:hypothetical protein VE03_07917 [Pseudogymnoascus sp. 23342-1-I1]|nr:hypothetical protein VE03_07917 [Pseudogymnoascus sp. 23342-1-I1]
MPFLETTLMIAMVSAVLATGSTSDMARALTDPTDYSWIKKFATVGDSFTAGIGSGGLYSTTDNSWECSRYSYTYPMIMNHFFGSSVTNFTYSACSRAISTEIFEQINALDSDQDLVVMTARGNDLCLSHIIDACIAGLGPSDVTCGAAVANAHSALGSNGYFKQNIKDLLTALDSKMATNGIVVQVLYAQYFNDKIDACTTEYWQVETTTGLPLNRDRRTQFNSLVVQTNAVIQEAVDEVAATAKTMKVVTANWDPWAPLTGGQFCELGASLDPRGKSNVDVMFFKLFTGVSVPLVVLTTCNSTTRRTSLRRTNEA